MEVAYPEGTSAPEHQVAGHIHGQGKTKLGILQGDGIYSGQMLKPGGPRELAFYRHVYGQRERIYFPTTPSNTTAIAQMTNEVALATPHVNSIGCGEKEDLDDDHITEDEVKKRLKRLIPRFMGTVTLNVSGRAEHYARLIDITKGFRKPCIMDVKVGIENADPLADDEKRMKEKAKFAALSDVKFMLTGMKYVNSSGDYVTVAKKELRSYLVDEVGRRGLRRFLPRNPVKRALLVAAFISRIDEIERLFSRQRIYEFHASSILFTYEAADIDTTPLPRYDVTMIDFAHVFPARVEPNGGAADASTLRRRIDRHYLDGVRSLGGYLAEIAAADFVAATAGDCCGGRRQAAQNSSDPEGTTQS